MKFKLTNDYIALGQLLKACDVVSSGGEVKYFLANCPVFSMEKKKIDVEKRFMQGMLSKPMELGSKSNEY